MQRIRATTLFIVFTLFMSVMDVSAIDYPEAEAWLNDYAGILSPEQQQELNSVLKDFENDTANQIVVCIMSVLPDNISIEEYANELFARWNPGQEGKDNGALLAIFINDRIMRIEVGYGLEGKLTDAASKLIIANDIVPAFQQENYYRGIKRGIDAMIRTIAGDSTPQSDQSRSEGVSAREPISTHYTWSDVLIEKVGEYLLIIISIAFLFAPVVILVLFVKMIRTSRIKSGSSQRDLWDDDDDSHDLWDDDDDSHASSGGFSGGGGESGGGGASGDW